jgi:hypothetical protein
LMFGFKILAQLKIFLSKFWWLRGPIDSTSVLPHPQTFSRVSKKEKKERKLTNALIVIPYAWVFWLSQWFCGFMKFLSGTVTKCTLFGKRLFLWFYVLSRFFGKFFCSQCNQFILEVLNRKWLSHWRVNHVLILTNDWLRWWALNPNSF